jgi:hypothetical protein
MSYSERLFEAIGAFSKDFNWMLDSRNLMKCNNHEVGGKQPHICVLS